MSSDQFDEGWVMIILLSCLAVAFSLISFGLGFVNLAGLRPPPLPITSLTPPPRPAPPPPAMDESQEEVDRQELEDLQRQLGKLRAELERLKKERDARQGEHKDVKNAVDQTQTENSERQRRLAAKRSSMEQEEAEEGAKARQRTADAAEMGRLQEEIERLEAQIEELKRKIAKRKASFDPMQIVPGSRVEDKVAKNPFWLECVKDAVVIQPQGQRFSVAQLQKKEAAFVSAVRDRYVVLLVRPDGFASFDAARSLAEAGAQSMGYEPVDADVEIEYPESGR